MTTLIRPNSVPLDAVEMENKYPVEREVLVENQWMYKTVTLFHANFDHVDKSPVRRGIPKHLS